MDELIMTTILAQLAVDVINNTLPVELQGLVGRLNEADQEWPEILDA